MQFMLTIYGDESAWAEMPPDGEREMMDAYREFGREAADVIVSGDALHPVASATTVRVRDGERLLTDGPFAETREQLGGYYIVDVADIDEAINWAAKIPGAATGSVEVRPIMVFAPSGAAAETG
jgi:hypothetical protein